MSKSCLAALAVAAVVPLVGAARADVPAQSCASAAADSCPPPAANGGPTGGLGGVTVVDNKLRMALRVTRSSQPPTVVIQTPASITCCAARLRGTVSISAAPHTGRLTAWVQVERDGGPQAVEQVSPAARLSGALTYRLHSDWSPLPSCSSYRYWFVARDNYGTTVAGPQTFSTACPPKYIAWSIGQFYRGASGAPALGTIDTQPAARALGRALGHLGYHSHTLVGGQRPQSILREVSASAVFAIFDHADAGNILTRGSGTNICATQGLVASGRYTFACAQRRWLRLGALPAADLWSVRLMIFGGCRTADSARYYGNLLTTATRLGVGSVIGFRDEVYFPGSSTNAASSTGDYFWARFAHYVGRGQTIRTALRRAQGDLIRKSGHAWGYDSWVISGASADPGALRLTISGPHAASDRPHAASDRPLGAVSESRDRAGDMTFFSAPASSAGPVRISIRRAGATAARFLLDRSPGIARRGLVLVGRQAVSHERGEALEGFAFRSRMNGVPGPAVADVEVDLRSGRVVFAAAGTVATRGARFRVGLAAARRIAAAAVGGGRVLSARRDIWRYPRWTVILRPRAKPGETAAVELDALDGRVMSISNADPS